ncbi:MAG: YfhO family protein [Thermoleophilaceae bacterium]|nr:YfhO family protein [Thermoleophilaceae bacterium]
MPGPTSWAARRPTLTAALVYLLLSFAMFAGALAPGRTLSVSDYLWTGTPWDSSRPADVPVLGSNREQTDSVFMFQPFLQHTRAELPDVPLWNPYIMGGRPFHANSQSATLSPFSVPAYVLPFWDSLAVAAALKLFVAALGAFLLARAFGLRFAGALLCGLVFGFSLWSVTWVSWTTMSVWALLPWLCLLAELCVRRPGPLPFAGLAAATGLQFLGGHPSSSFQVMVAVALFWVVRVVASRRLREHDLRLRLFTLGAALVTGSALAAITLIPFVELLSHSIDLKARTAAASDAHEPARYLLGVFLHDWWGRGSRAPLEFASALEEHAWYVAALPLMLAVSALVLAPRRERIVVAAVGLVALAVATGIPPFFDVVKALPGFDAARNGRLAVVSVLCVAVLAGWGLDDLTGAAAPERRRRLALAACALLFCVPFAWVARRIDLDALGDALRVAWGFAEPEPGAVAEIRLASLLEWLVLGAAALLLVVLRLRGRLGTAAFAGLALALVVLDLFKAGMGYNPAIEESHAVQPATPAIRYLQEQRPARFAGLRPEAPITLAVPISPNVAMRYGLYDARGYDFPFEERYAELWRRVIAQSPDCNYAFCPESAGRSPRALQALGLLGVTDLLQNRRDPPLRGFEVAYDGPDARVYRNPSALPRAFLVDRQVVAPSAEAARDAVTAANFPARSVAVTEKRIPGIPEGTAASAAGSARISSYRDEHVVLNTDAERRALLVLTDSWFPGWKASVDGRDVPIERVDYLIRGVPVPAGKHEVEFRYEPASWRAGWIVSLLALIAILGAAGVGWRRHA